MRNHVHLCISKMELEIIEIETMEKIIEKSRTCEEYEVMEKMGKEMNLWRR